MEHTCSITRRYGHTVFCFVSRRLIIGILLAVHTGDGSFRVDKKLFGPLLLATLVLAFYVVYSSIAIAVLLITVGVLMWTISYSNTKAV